MIDRPLYHFTCSHGHGAIGDAGLLQPGPAIHDDVAGFVWATDLSWPIAKALGLTMKTLACDRTKFRYEVDDTSEVVSWMDARKELSEEYVFMLELAEGAMPRHWFLSLDPVPAHYSPINRR